MSKAWAIKHADGYLYHQGLRRATQGMPFVDEKNPAKAYSFSLFFWGAGQTYSGLRMKGVLFQTLMVLALIVVVFSLLYGKELLGLLREEHILYADVFLWVEVLFFAALCFWNYNAADAYRSAAKGRRVPFRGVESRFLPMFCSLVVPGWGQFMNGQPLKGALLGGFSVASIFTVLMVPAVLFFWPYLEPSRSRFMIEMIFSGGVLYSPVSPLISVLSAHDALTVSLDETKKDLILDRIARRITLIRIEGWRHGIFPLLKSSAVIILIVASFLIIRSRYHFPVNYYSIRLIETRTWLQNKGMTVLPDLIDRVLSREYGDVTAKG